MYISEFFKILKDVFPENEGFDFDSSNPQEARLSVLQKIENNSEGTEKVSTF